MRWIREHKLISVLIGVLLTLVILFAVSVFAENDNNPVSGTVNKGMSAVSGVLSNAADTVRDNIAGLFSYKSLQAQIEQLESENEQLRKQLAETKLEREDLEQLQELSGLLNYEYLPKNFDIVSADITSLDGANWTNIFTINKGTEEGIEAGDAVVNNMGLVGRIQAAGEGWSKVVSIIDEETQVSFKLERDRKQLGIASGNSVGNVSGYMMSAESTVAQGDVIITSGLGTYPEGLLIGNVKSVVYNSNTLLKEITVEPAVNFKGLEKVAVIK